MNKLKSSIFALIIVSSTANALTYYVDDNEGNRWYMNRPSRDGTYPNSLSTVSNSKPHPDGIALRVETSLEKSKCIASALAACDPEFGGIRLFINGEPPTSCDFVTAASYEVESGTYATSLVPYNGMIVTQDGKEVCKVGKPPVKP